MSSLFDFIQSYCRDLLAQAVFCRRGDLRTRLERLAFQCLEEMISEQYEQAKRTLWITKIIIQFAISISEIPFPAGKSLIDKIDFINSEIRKQSEFPNYSINQTVEETITEEDFFDINKEIDHQLIENNDINKETEEDIIRKDLNSEIRQTAILEKIRKNPYLGLKDIVNAFPEVTDRTLRYDLQKLSQQGFIIKIGNRGPNTVYRVE